MNSIMWAIKLLRYLLMVAAAWFILTYIIIAILRLQYPYELEWMEAGMVDHAQRVLSGQKLYVRPSLEFVPFIYTPLFVYLSAIVSKATGIGFEPLRLISFTSSLGSFLLIFLIINRETGNKFAALLSTGLFAATFRIGGAWFDIARVDSLALFLLLLGTYALRFYRPPLAYIAAGLILSLSFLTKQSALAVIIPLALYCVLQNRRQSPFYIVTAVITLGVTTLALEYLHDGWYSYYIFELPRQHLLLPDKYLGFWQDDLLELLPIATTMAIFYLIISQFSGSNKDSVLFYSLFAAGMLGGSWFSRLHTGGWDNVLIPGYAAIAVLFGLSTHSLLQFFRSESVEKRLMIEAFVMLAAVIQLATLIYNPVEEVPTQEDLEAGHEFVSILRQIEGDVLVTHHGFLPQLADKNSYAHWAAVFDILRGDKETPEARMMFNDLQEAIEEKRFDAIILNSENFPARSVAFKKYYEKQRLIFSDKSVFWPVTGFQTRPKFIFVPRASTNR
jgi:4-amino-4-deoxy-L-arabinose transferase-like glycosyltransferase